MPSEVYGDRSSTRIRRAITAASTQSARAPATTRVNASPRGHLSIATASTLEIKVLRIFNTYGPRMSHSDGRVVSNFIVQR